MSTTPPSPSAPAPIPWTHRLVARYYRAPEHPSRLRLLALLKRLLGVGTVRAAVVPGVVMELDDNDFVQREILFRGGYELGTLARFDALLGGARGMLDFGAHMGLYTLRAARALASRSGRVFAIEPTPGHSAALLHNAALSGLTNIELCTCAISTAPALMRMIAPHPANTGGSRLAAGNEAVDLRSIPLHVPVLTAAELVPLVPSDCLDLVKIDVEGHEFHILRSLLAAAPRRPRNILFEYKPSEFDYGPTETTTGWLRAAGYELRTITGAAFDPSVPLPEDNLWAHLRD